MTMRRTSLALAAIGGLWLGTNAGWATSMSPMNLADLTGRSKQIVVGTVTAVTQGRQGALAYQQVELRVSETIRGAARSTMTFRQLDPQSPQAPENGRRYVGVAP